MNKTRICLVTAALFTWLSNGYANSLTQTEEAYLDRIVGTLSVTSQPFISEGVVTGCTFVFNALNRDHVYRQGDFIRISGSFGLMKSQNTVGVTVKVIVNEMVPDSNGQIVLKPSTPDRAYLVGQGYKNNLHGLVTSAPSDTEGGIFAIYQIEPSLPILMEQIQTQIAVIGFNRAGGKSDNQVRIDLTVENFTKTGERLHNQKAVQEFSECMLALLEDIR